MLDVLVNVAELLRILGAFCCPGILQAWHPLDRHVLFMLGKRLSQQGFLDSPACPERRIERNDSKNHEQGWLNAQVRVRTVRRRARLLYLPAYVADYKFGEAFNAHGERRPQRFKAIVSGLDASRIAAERHFSPHKVWHPLGNVEEQPELAKFPGRQVS